MTTKKPHERPIGTIIQAVELLAEPGQVLELRIPKVDGRDNRTDSGYFDDPRELAKAAANYNGRAAGIYITLDPINPALLARAKNRVIEYAKLTTSDSDIVTRRWLKIDVDPRRPAGISATENEHEAALQVCTKIQEWLTGRGWSAPIAGDSGNGGHLLYRIDLPNTPDNTALIQRCLQALDAYFSDETVSVDTGVFNAARIWKLYGTKAAKGDHTEARPHRWAQLLDLPDPIEPVSLTQLEALAAMAPGTLGPDAPGHRAYSEQAFDLERWLSDHNIAGRKSAWNGGTRWKLDKCPFSETHSDGAFVVQLANGAIAAGCHHNSCQGKGWADLRELFDGPKPVYTNGTGPSEPKNAPKENRAPKTPAPKMADYIETLAELGYTFKWNEGDDTIEVNGAPIDNGLAAEIRARMRDLGFSRIQALEDAYTAYAYHNRYHPVRAYLTGLQWDGQNHVAKLSRYFKDVHPRIVYGSKAGSIFQTWLVRWLIGAVAKIFEAGTVRGQNPMLVLDGPQNLGKSTFVRWLGSPLPNLFIESAIRPDNKDHDRYLATKWVWEVSELGATTRRADREALKAFISCVDVTFRKPYDRHPVVKPAMASFIGTINNEAGFLTDTTGNRRFLSVTLEAINRAYINDIDVNQVWAQAYALYRQGEPWQLLPQELEMRDALNTGYEVEDPLEGWVLKYYMIDPDNSETYQQDKDGAWFMTTADIAGYLGTMGISGSTLSIQQRLATTLKSLGLREGRAGGTRGRRGFWGVQLLAESKP